MVYQPKLCLHDGSITCVEALLRWQRGKQLGVSTTEFIEIAEEAGLISDITKLVIAHVIRQTKKWSEAGIPIKVALNVAPQDLHNSAVIHTLIDAISACGLPSSLIEVELTERGIMENDDCARVLLNLLSEQGIHVSLDDFGAGCTCLLSIMALPFNFVKIDKGFIDSLSDDHFKFLVEEIIAFAHKTGKKVVAEGVEKKAQVEILRAMDCDYIQGLYLSAPLLPEDVVPFISGHRPDCGKALGLKAHCQP